MSFHGIQNESMAGTGIGLRNSLPRTRAILEPVSNVKWDESEASHSKPFDLFSKAHA